MDEVKTQDTVYYYLEIIDIRKNLGYILIITYINVCMNITLIVIQFLLVRINLERHKKHVRKFLNHLY